MIIYNEWLMCQIYSLGIAVYSVSAEERNGLQVNVISDLEFFESDFLYSDKGYS